METRGLYIILATDDVNDAKRTLQVGLKNHRHSSELKTFLEKLNDAVTNEDLDRGDDKLQSKLGPVTRSSVRKKTPPDDEYMPAKRTIKHKKTKRQFKTPKPLENKHRRILRELISNSNATPLRSKTIKGYQCFFCNQCELQPSNLKQHTIDKHRREITSVLNKLDCASIMHVKLDITDLECVLCNKEFNTLEAIKEHLVKVHKKQIDLQIKNHVVPVKFGDSGELICCVCGHVTSSVKNLTFHMNTHYPNYSCNECGISYISNRSLDAHKKSHHKTTPHECRYCDETFENLALKTRHERKVHNVVTQFAKCPVCFQRFNCGHAKRRHLALVHGIITRMDFKCNICEKVMSSQDVCRAHVRRVHLLERRVKCPQCDEAFFGNYSLKQHLLVHTGQKDYQCDVCKKRYGQKSTLRTHMETHSDVKRLMCELCGLSFLRKFHLRGHVKLVHGPAS